MNTIICPGIHDPKLTESFVNGLRSLKSSNSSNIGLLKNPLIFPTQEYPAFSAFHILQFLQKQQPPTSPLVFISFSAGVVGAIGAAWGWQLMGGQVKAFIAVDGWGVPLSGNFPIYRLSHDYFTHWSSALLGSGQDSFYAAPSVEHLELWRNPQQIAGWWVHSEPGKSEQKTLTTAGQFLAVVLSD